MTSAIYWVALRVMLIRSSSQVDILLQLLHLALLPSLREASFFPLRDDLANTEPLLHAEVNQTTDTLLQPKESYSNYTNDTSEASVDITALYDRNCNGWHPLQNNPPTSQILGRPYSSGVAEGNDVLQDFKEAFKIPAGSGLSESTNKRLLQGLTTSATAGSESSPENTFDSTERKRFELSSGDSGHDSHT